jgi:pimeloyl-ACP methyl ester carboxylesterase
VALLQAGGFDIDVSDSGAAAGAPGRPLVALHSSGLSRRQWGRLAASMSGERRVVCANLLGYGESGPFRDDATFTWEDDAKLAAALLGTLDTPVHLVGHSYGGLVALRVAMTHPERVHSLVVFEPVAFAVLHAPDDVAALADLERARRAEEDRGGTGGDASWLEAFVDYWSGPGAWRALPAAARDGFLAVGRKVFAEVSTLSDDRTPRAAFAAIAVPTLLLSGGRSTLAARNACAILADTLPHASLQTIPDAGHMGPLTHADVVNATIAAFVARVG